MARFTAIPPDECEPNQGEQLKRNSIKGLSFEQNQVRRRTDQYLTPPKHHL
jgi:hypothetical protein